MFSGTRQFFENTAMKWLFPCCSPECCSLYWLSPPLSSVARLHASGQPLTSVAHRLSRSKCVRSDQSRQKRNCLTTWKRRVTVSSGPPCTINMVTRFIYATRATNSKFVARYAPTGNWAKSGELVALGSIHAFGNSVKQCTTRRRTRISSWRANPHSSGLWCFACGKESLGLELLAP